MLSFPLSIRATDPAAFREILQTVFTFLRHLTPKKRTEVHLHLWDPPVPLLDLAELLNQSGFRSHTTIRTSGSSADGNFGPADTGIWIHQGSLSESWVVQEICRNSRILVCYSNRPGAGHVLGGWYQEIREGHPEDRSMALFQLLHAFFQDRKAYQMMRLRAREAYLKYVASPKPILQEPVPAHLVRSQTPSGIPFPL